MTKEKVTKKQINGALRLVLAHVEEAHRQECFYCSRGSGQLGHDPECPILVLRRLAAQAEKP